MIIIGMAGAHHLIGAIKQRAHAAGISIEQAGVSMSAEDRDAAIREGLPPFARAAYVAGFERVKRIKASAGPATTSRFAEALNRAHDLNPHLESYERAPSAPKENPMSAPTANTLSPDERNVCRLLGITEQQFLDGRQYEASAAMAPAQIGAAHGLDATEVDMCRRLGQSFETFAESKRLRAR